METILTLNVAGLATALHLTQDRPGRWHDLRERYAAFITDQVCGGIHVAVHFEEGAPFIGAGSQPTVQIRTVRLGNRIYFTSHLEQGWINLAERRALVTVRTNGHVENFLRVLYAWWSLAGGGLLIHACGVIDATRGYVFFGPSGAGKSTLAALSGQRTILSDDLVILRKQRGHYHVCGVPFRGTLAEAPRANTSAPLHTLCTLAKAPTHGLRPLRAEEGIARLASAVPFVMSQPATAAHVLAIAAEIANTTPVQVLQFHKDAGFWEVLDA